MRGRLPSIGFVAVCATYVLAALFFWRGLSTPVLDRVWWLDHGLKTGRITRLAPGDRALLADALARHPALGGALLGGRTIGILSEHTDGWIATPTVVVLRTPASGAMSRLRLDVQTPADLLPCSLEMHGPGWSRTLELERHGVRFVDLPPPAETTAIIELELGGRDFPADPSMLGLRITFGEGGGEEP